MLVYMSTTDLNRYIAGEVRAAMSRKQVTTAELADRIGVSSATLHRRMSGATPFTVTELAAISHALDVAYPTFWPDGSAA